MRLGLIGCGTIGGAVAAAVLEGKLPGTDLIGIVDLVESEAALKLSTRAGCPFWTEITPLLSLRPDLIVEAASQAAARAFAPTVLGAGIDLMIVSAGALSDAKLLAKLDAAASLRGARVHVPSGAIGGVDIIRAAAVAGLDECMLTTTKPPQALAGAPCISAMGIELEAITEAQVIYEGAAAEAVRLFPQNVNVAATISLAGIGLQRTVVRIVADPAATRNTHEIFLRGAFGEATVRLVNLPSPGNPKSSYLASLSVIAALQRISRPLQLGS